jgi:four helix bundle protein
MALKFGELKILKAAEDVSDEIWKQVIHWDPFVRDVVGKQLAKAADSIGANIAEAFGRFHYGEKVQFLYYARGSLFETKYWLNRSNERELIPERQTKEYAQQLSELARQLNTFISNMKAQRRGNQPNQRTISDSTVQYKADQDNGVLIPLFEDEELQWIENT